MHRLALVVLPAALSVSVALPVLHGRASAQPAPNANSLLYADFEKMENGRPVSARGGRIQLFSYEESGVHKSVFKGLEGVDPPAPELVRIKKDDPNHAMKFDYSLRAPNQYAGVTVEIHGKPDVDGKFDPDDVSGYKVLSLQVYATGIDILRLEAVSHGSGKDTGTVHPLMKFRVKPQMNTYRIPLSGFTQPEWAKDVRIDPKEVFRKLSSINLSAFCDLCELNKDGMVIVDNMVFEK